MACTPAPVGPRPFRLPTAGRSSHQPVGEGEGRAGRPRPRATWPLSRDEDRVVARPRDVERSRDDEARSSRAGAGGSVRLLGAQNPLSVSHPLARPDSGARKSPLHPETHLLVPQVLLPRFRGIPPSPSPSPKPATSRHANTSSPSPDPSF